MYRDDYREPDRSTLPFGTSKIKCECPAKVSKTAMRAVAKMDGDPSRTDAGRGCICIDSKRTCGVKKKKASESPAD